MTPWLPADGSRDHLADTVRLTPEEWTRYLATGELPPAVDQLPPGGNPA